MADSCIKQVHGLMKDAWYARWKSRKKGLGISLLPEMFLKSLDSNVRKVQVKKKNGIR